MKVFLMMLCLALPLAASAHKDHDHSLSATARAAVKSAETAVVAAAVAAPGAITQGASASTKVDFGAIFQWGLTSHRHNKVVHFPIALGLAGVLFGLLAYKFESMKSSSRWLLFLAALASIAAILSGRAQEDSVEGVLAKQVFEAHEMQGYITCGLLWLNWLMSFFESARKWSWVLLLILAVVILGTSMMGGYLAHAQF